MPTVHDVARQASVSIATVSRVFGHPDAVAAATRARVLDAADQLGYTPSWQDGYSTRCHSYSSTTRKLIYFS